MKIVAFGCSFVLLLWICTCSDDPAGDPAVDAAGQPDAEADVVETSAEPDLAYLDDCPYPVNTGIIDLGKIMPHLRWEGAYLGDGTTFDFDLHEVYCSPEWDDYTTLLFSVTAGWCPACPSQIEYLDSIATDLEEAGALLIHVETQTADGLPATHESSHEHVERYVDENGPGIRIGDGETLPEPMSIYASPIITHYPNGFMVRRSDMRVIASQSGDTYPPYVEIAQNPDEAWSAGNPTGDPTCGPEDEETYEPNNTMNEAAEIEGPSFSGGICDTYPDFYYIPFGGHWYLQIDFEQDVGDLDMFLWDEETNDIMVDGAGRPMGSGTATSDEGFQWEGPATIVIFGYAGATSTYTLWLAEI